MTSQLLVGANIKNEFQPSEENYSNRNPKVENSQAHLTDFPIAPTSEKSQI